VGTVQAKGVETEGDNLEVVLRAKFLAESEDIQNSMSDKTHSKRPDDTCWISIKAPLVGELEVRN